jgi:hypothetical protein
VGFGHGERALRVERLPYPGAETPAVDDTEALSLYRVSREDRRGIARSWMDVKPRHIVQEAGAHELVSVGLDHALPVDCSRARPGGRRLRKIPTTQCKLFGWHCASTIVL